MSFNSALKSLPRNFFNLLGAVGMFLLVAGCVLQSGKNENENKPPAPQANTAKPVTADAAEKKDKREEDAGDFIVEHLGVKNARYGEFDRKVKEEKLLEKAADTLNRSLILPYDIYLRTKDCGEVNALYDSADHSITICYELMEHFQKLFRSEGSGEREADEKMFDAVRFAFLHELGHALIDAYKLPITGSEEDAADRCSSYICLEEMGEDGIRAVLAAADAFHIEAKQSSPSGKDFSDEHLLQEQRFYNTLCMIYGSNTTKYNYFVSRKYLPEARAARCSNEYERMAQSWSELLQKWRKD
ncbi:MAG TPA: DUF4344 domain-containing metallopeptidase [Pyrinomonadaceae bacterium]|jgi:hypothetical protein